MSLRRPGPLDALDRLPHVRQHDTRHHFSTAAMLCHLPESVSAYLRGDVVNTKASSSMARYLHRIATHEDVNHVAEKILALS